MELTLDTLIRDVKQSSEDPLVQLDEASQTAAELDDLGDSLLNHFVDICRRSGHSWAQIGEHLGVTRQAAQQRFPRFDAHDTATFERFTQRARDAVERTEQAARELGHNYIGTEHILLALFDDRESLAAKALAALGVTRANVVTAIVARAPRGPVEIAGPLPFTPRAKRSLLEALSAALQLGHNYVGTEHILLGLYRAPEGLAAVILTELGADRDAARANVVELLSTYLGAAQKK